MREGMIRFATLTGAVAQAALWLAGIGLVLMTAFVFAQVFFRYVMGSSLFWAEPAAVMLMGWFIFLGAAVGVKEGYHLSFDVGLMVVPESWRPWFHSLSDVVVTAFGFGMAWFGWQLAARAASGVVPGIGISRLWDFAPLIGGGILLMLFSVERILRRAAGLKTMRFGDMDDAADGVVDGAPGAVRADDLLDGKAARPRERT
ncbi:TRAP transporter small permease subunit [Paracoccus sp. 08]|jgi:TRAP-type C4-dicarboxylate transport system permease small subunit|uniref:TRAP transporter small permease protein n=2 Tax=Paracoccus TaxID=265 RepID=A0A5C4R5N3_9RHOB|nr:TRAP transporter small permease [Paracoccus sp. Arc7-R13]MCO6361692.1 TRAP transporter small permease subunit [Paracoccus sp. 08]TNC05191.1 TRAP transporter small permease [Paracoccus marcusii]TNH39229.1 TRAP transporter small permease [Paracoccus haeundaensis]TYP60796.1 TRAP-type C4-dicarboxylate transport system permease small subunit [Stutzerimonas stutzeri]|tara:strand:+ start:3782 stop:4387 length:606 start_codon:yes stop_codon:yes gene_type:complete